MKFYKDRKTELKIKKKKKKKKKKNYQKKNFFFIYNSLMPLI